jgi:rod shape-determining protein MreD
MGQKTAIFLFLFLMGILEVSLFSNLFSSRIAPDILLIIIIIWSAQKYFENVWAWSLVSGLILDLMTFRTIGTEALVFLAISSGVEFLTKRFFFAQRSRAFFMIAFFILGGTIINYAYLGLISREGGLGFSNLFFKIISNLAAYPFIYWLMVKLKNTLQINQEKLITK